MIEAQSIQVIDKTSRACDYKKHKEVHSGEPIELLTLRDMDRYSTAMHQRSGLPGEDARRIVRTVREEYNQGDQATRTRIAMTIKSTIEGLLGTRQAKQELIPVQEEITVFER